MTKTNSSGKNDCFVSVIALMPSDNILASFLRETQQCLNRNFSDYEIVLLDQHTGDDNTQIIKPLLKEISAIRYLKLAFPVHTDVAIAAAVENAIGDYVVFITPDNDPIEEIPNIVETCRNGSDVVFGIATVPKSIGYAIFRPLAKFLTSKIGYKLPKDATSFCCFSRRAVNTITQTGRYHHQFFVKAANTGYQNTTFQYSILPNNKSKRTLHHGLRKTTELLVFNSTKPLRWMSTLGLIGSMLAFFFATYSITIRIFKDHVIEGWTSMILFTSLLFMIMFAILAFFGEYLGRLLDDRSEHREYFVSYELTSSVMLEEERVNVLTN